MERFKLINAEFEAEHAAQLAHMEEMMRSETMPAPGKEQLAEDISILNDSRQVMVMEDELVSKMTDEEYAKYADGDRQYPGMEDIDHELTAIATRSVRSAEKWMMLASNDPSIPAQFPSVFNQERG